jgi:hypothetical protein
MEATGIFCDASGIFLSPPWAVGSVLINVLGDVAHPGKVRQVLIEHIQALSDTTRVGF